MKLLGKRGIKIAEKVLILEMVVILVILVYAIPDASSEVEIKPYGFFRLDIIYNDSKTNNNQITMWVNSEPSDKEDDAGLSIHPRLTRVGFNVTGGKVGTANISGNLEIDFQQFSTATASGHSHKFSESRAAIRMRHAFLKVRSGDLYLLAGQTWDIISPLLPSVNQDTLMWNAGNTGDRRPQLRLGFEPPLGTGKLSLIGALGLAGAIDSKDLDGNGIADGEDSVIPNLQARVGFSFKGLVDKEDIVIGGWGHTAKEELGKGANPIGGEDNFTSKSIGLDITIPIISLPPDGSLTIRGEFWTGENLSDLRGGIGQGVNTTTGKEIESNGGWLELLAKFTPRFLASIGYTLDNPVADDLADLSKTKNYTWYITGLVKPGGGLAFGVEYINWTTEYKNAPKGTDNRIDLIGRYNF